jgi:hypothetical protein
MMWSQLSSLFQLTGWPQMPQRPSCRMSSMRRFRGVWVLSPVRRQPLRTAARQCCTALLQVVEQ